jgi:ATP-dependent DNA ligase
MAQIAGDEGSAEWKSSRPASRGRVKAAWLADAIARADQKRKSLNAEGAEKKANQTQRAQKKKSRSPRQARDVLLTRTSAEEARAQSCRVQVDEASNPLRTLRPLRLKLLPALRKEPCPRSSIRCWLLPPTKAFDDPDWLFEIKWDGYRAVAFIEDGACAGVAQPE